MRWTRVCLGLLWALLGAAALAPPSWAAEARARGEHLEVELLAERPGLVPGADARLGLVFRTEEHWHLYWRFVGDSGEPPQATWTLPPGFAAGPIEWPAPTRFVRGPVAGFGYTGEFLLPVTLRVPADLVGPTVRLVVDLTWLVCDEECVPGEARLTLELPVLAEAAPPDPRALPLFARADADMPRPWPAEVRLSAPADRVHLRLEGSGPWTGQDALWTWFPTTPLRFDHAADVEVRAEGTTVLLGLPLAPGRTPPPRLEGVLEARVGETRFAFTVDLAMTGGEASGGSSSTSATGPARAAATATLPPSPQPPRVGDGAPLDGPANVWQALLLAFLGGLILNVMPCVLPVIAVKVLGFVQQAGEDPGRVRRHGYVFALGVVASFWALAGLLLVLRHAGEGLGWGFQFQDPRFTGALCLLMLLVGLNLFGVFEVGTVLAGRAGSVAAAAHGGYAGSFWNGVLATVVATPCTAPFMGPAIAFALAVPPLLALLVFTSLGIGMAAPYLVLSLAPRWLAWLPRPGAWMETFKHLMAFPMLAVVVGVGYVFGRQTGVGGLTWLLAGLLAASLGAWLYGRWGGVSAGTLPRLLVGRGLALLLLVAAVGAILVGSGREPDADAAPPTGWIPWRPGIEEEIRAQGHAVFVDFTADWCLTCKANDVAVLSTETVHEAARRLGVVLVMADWTRKSKDVRDALKALGRASVPVYVVYPADPTQPPTILPTVLTPGVVVEALEAATSRGP